MIRPLRQRHRAIFLVLGVALPVGFATGLLARRPIPMARDVAPELAGAATDFGRLLWTKPDVWPDQQAITSLRRNSAGNVSIQLQFHDLVRADALVYWAGGHEDPGASLPANARLLGSLGTQLPLPVPDAIRGQPGRFILYSLGDHELVAVSRPLVLDPR